jgi:hypothetical protein
MKTARVLLLSLIILFSTTIFAQYENTSGQKNQKSVVQNNNKPNPWFVGGMIGGGFSTSSSYLELSPIVGYHVTPALDVGTRITYIYRGVRYFTGGPKYNSHIYGASLFGRYKFLNFLMAHVEYGGISNQWYDYDGNSTRKWVNSLFVGGGLYQSVGGRGFATITILYDVFEDPNSPYTNPLIRIGFGVGL